MFPFSKNNPEALELGISLRYAMASGLFFLGMLLFICRGVTRSAAQRLLFCCGLGFCNSYIKSDLFKFLKRC